MLARMHRATATLSLSRFQELCSSWHHRGPQFQNGESAMQLSTLVRVMGLTQLIGQHPILKG